MAELASGDIFGQILWFEKRKLRGLPNARSRRQAINQAHSADRLPKPASRNSNQTPTNSRHPRPVNPLANLRTGLARCGCLCRQLVGSYALRCR